MAAAVPSGGDSKGNSNILLLLSLKLILLAFFILLNSLSDFESEKTRAVIESVNQTFNGEIHSPYKVPGYSAALGALPEADRKIDEVGSLFEAILPSSRAKRMQRAQSYLVDLPAAELFKPGTLSFRPGRDVLIQRLAETLGTDRRDDLTFYLDVLIGVGASLGEDGRDRLAKPPALEVHRVALVAQRLIEQGLPSPSLAIGLLPDRPGIVRFIVRARHAPPVAASGAAGKGQGQ